MQLEYLSDHNRQTAPVLLVYGDEPDDAVVLRGAADELAVGEIGTRCASTVSPASAPSRPLARCFCWRRRPRRRADQRAPPGLSMRTAFRTVAGSTRTPGCRIAGKAAVPQ